MRKFFPYIVILVMLVGIFIPLGSAHAQTAGTGNCWYKGAPNIIHDPATCAQTGGTFQPTGSPAPTNPPDPNGQAGTSQPPVTCTGISGGIPIPVGCTPAAGTPTGSATPPTPPADQSTFVNAITAESCGLIFQGSVPGCAKIFFYYVIYLPSSFILLIAAKFFNALIAIALGSTLISGSAFISTAWGVVRDLSNIFFILVLLYIAVKIILDLGGHEAKKMIAKVIIIAMLINFSMFFTEVIIDSSNILALIFYNKLNVSTKNPDGSVRDYETSTGAGEKDISGAMYTSFDPTSKLDSTFWDQTRGVGQKVGGNPVKVETYVPTGIMIAVVLIAAAVMLFAAYAFMVAGISFVARLIELWVLIIFSPFAFMSSTIPLLSGIDYIGWGSWFKRLLKVSFMAPIFMFFMYFIFLLLNAKLFSGLVTTTGMVQTLLAVLIPAMMILILLLKATEFAKKGSGAIGEAVFSGAKLVAGLALGGGALGVAALGRGLIGATAKSVQSSSATRMNTMRFADTRKKFNSMNKVNPFAWAGLAGTAISGVGKAATATIAEGIHRVPTTQTAPVAGGGTRRVTLGEKLQQADAGYGHKTHATHILDAKMQAEFGHQYGKDAKYKDLSEPEQAIVKGEVDKDEMAKFIFGKLFKDLEAPQAAEIQARYKGGTAYTNAAGLSVTSGPAERAIDNGHGTTISVADPSTITGHQKIKSDSIVDMSKANSALGEFVQALRKGSFDLRNLPDMKAKTKGFPKFGLALIAGVAAGVRLGIKKGGGVEYGTAQKDVFKDIGNTISESLKNIKISISTGGGHGGGDSHVKEVKSVGH